MGLLSQALVLLLATPIFSNPISTPLEERQGADVYDYIVVGSGPGGGPLASNLARANYSVLLIEAGDTSTQGSSGQYPPQITWDFFVKHYSDEKRQKMNNHLTWKTADGSYWVGKGTDTPPAGSTFLGVYYPRGATVGGSSMINAMVTWLPPDSDWDYIGNITGDKSWSGANMRKIFERIEKNNYLTRGTAGHGFDGYFETNLNKVSRLDQPVSGIVQAICANFSQDYTKATTLMSSDPNYLDPKRDFTTSLYGLASHTKANGQRYSSRDRVTDTINKKFPLTLSQNSLATKVLFDTSASACGGKPKATGIEYLQGKSIYKADARYKEGNTGTRKTATARKEVILSGGAFNTPQLLMLSGIGPKEDLQKFDIPVLVDSPGVGNNMQDNQEMPIIGKVSGNQAAGFSQPILMMKTPFSPDGERDMFVMQGPGFAFRGFWPSNQTNRGCCTEQPNIYGISMVKNHPQNKKGYVKLRSKDPQDTPEINFAHFEEGKDVDMGAMKYTIAWARNIYKNAQGVSVSAIEPPCPSGQMDAQGGCGAADEDWITGQTFGHHPACTAAIGGDNDKNAVLDSRFRVRGVANLRVVDASVFPRLPGVFPVVSTFMTSERASDTLLEDAKNPVCK